MASHSHEELRRLHSVPISADAAIAPPQGPFVITVKQGRARSFYRKRYTERSQIHGRASQRLGDKTPDKSQGVLRAARDGEVHRDAISIFTAMLYHRQLIPSTMAKQIPQPALSCRSSSVQLFGKGFRGVWCLWRDDGHFLY